MTTIGRVLIPVEPEIETAGKPMLLDVLVHRPSRPYPDASRRGALAGFAEAGVEREGRAAIEALDRLGTLPADALWGLDVTILSGGRECIGDGLVLGFALALAMAVSGKVPCPVLALGALDSRLGVKPARFNKLRRAMRTVARWDGVGGTPGLRFFVPEDIADIGGTGTVLERDIAALGARGVEVSMVSSLSGALEGLGASRTSVPYSAWRGVRDEERE